MTTLSKLKAQTAKLKENERTLLALEEALGANAEISAGFALHVINNELEQVETSQEPVTNADGVDSGFTNVWEGNCDDENVIVTQLSNENWIIQTGKQTLIDLSLDSVAIFCERFLWRPSQ